MQHSRSFIGAPFLRTLSALLVFAVAANAQRNYTVVNNCPAPVDLYIGSAKDSTLAKGANTTKVLGNDAGFFYTTANGGKLDGSATRAGFYGDHGATYYYIVKDVGDFNAGISIKPNHPERKGLCAVARCDNAFCHDAFAKPPTRFPRPSITPPASPVYSCPFHDVAYTITFCPSGSFPHAPPPPPPPPPAYHAIHPNFYPNKCIDVLKKGSTKVQVAGTNFCLHAGSNSGNTVGMKIWQCYDNLPAQQWYYTDDNRIALEGKGLCLDLTDGILSNSNRLQTWQCTDGNANQIWTE
ncbi:ricin B lectin domain-containing protein [Gymnopilus junonius]|uniref:Ricin B lectin domain-containing protein n=1 Tax=Gymnopilus junonius TaxID=109634 RepID=A0A9P5P3T3_GYMJU|nr:ricin B lectin domain-containing protein [Gymnopilus junonius]